jgi:ABC-type uncharacterized transport system auxiliary subunit
VRSAESRVGTLAIEALTVDAAYDTERMVYRRSPYRLDYYYYHRWSAAPALHLRDTLRQAYARTGAFREVVESTANDDTLVLGGRVFALEEVDVTEQHWFGRMGLELWLSDPRSQRRLWSAVFTEQELMVEQNPEGLAKAISVALDRIVAQSTSMIAAAMRDEAQRAQQPRAEAPRGCAEPTCAR